MTIPDNFMEGVLFCIKAHIDVNQKYDIHPYAHHLQMVANIAYEHSYILPEDKIQTVLLGAYAHDLIEDANLTYNDVKDALGEEVAEISYALTNEKGKTRDESSSDKYYREMKLVPFAVYVKLCDRIANTVYSKENGSSMFEKYKKEYPKFRAALYEAGNVECQPLWGVLDNLYNS